MKKNPLLTLVEIVVMGGILFALIYPLFSSTEEESSFLDNSIHLKNDV